MSAAPLTVGVTGHRDLADRDGVAAQVRGLIDTVLDHKFPGGGSRPVVVLSSLAEGADRVVAADVLARPDGTLVAVLPLPEPDYATDFALESSRLEFRALLRRAARVITVSETGSRPHVYQVASRFVVDHSDVLIGLWDGVHSTKAGGTADTIAYARACGRPLAVHTLRVERGGAGAVGSP